MQSTVPSVVRFKDKAATNLSFDADIRLIALGNIQRRIETAGESGVQNPKLLDERRVGSQCPRKFKIGGNERASLRRRQQFAGRRIDQSVGVEEKLLRAQREIVDGSQQRAVVENPGAGPN